MTIFDYLLNIGLVSLVVLQMRGRRLDRRGLLLPLVIVLWAASRYLHGIPTTGNDLAMVAAGVTIGGVLGTASGIATRIDRGSDGVLVARATAVAAALWIVGIGSRLGFSLWTSHGGAPTVGRFSIAHHLSPAGWVTAFVLMAFAEVLSRTLVLWLRSRSAAQPPTVALAC